MGREPAAYGSVMNQSLDTARNQQEVYSKTIRTGEGFFTWPGYVRVPKRGVLDRLMLLDEEHEQLRLLERRMGLGFGFGSSKKKTIGG